MNEMQKPLTAVIAGATGLTGSFLLPLLLQENRYDKVIALSRRPLSVQHPKLSTILSDGKDLGTAFSQAGLIGNSGNSNTLKAQPEGKPLEGAHIFCCLGTTMAKAGSKPAFEAVDLEYPVNLGKICLEMGARHYLLISALGADADSGIYYNRVKGLCERRIQELQYPQFSVFRPSILDGPRQEKRVGEKIGLIMVKALSPLLQGSFKKYRPTQVSDLAKRMADQAWKQENGFWIIEG